MLKCKDCPIYDQLEKVCTATIIIEGEYFEIKTNPDDNCFWQENNIPLQEISSITSRGTSYNRD